MAQRIRYEVLPNTKAESKRGLGRWKLTKNRALVLHFNLKTDAVVYAVTLANSRAAGGERSTLKIKGLNGRVQDERTYPRSTDPRGSKG